MYNIDRKSGHRGTVLSSSCAAPAHRRTGISLAASPFFGGAKDDGVYPAGHRVQHIVHHLYVVPVAPRRDVKGVVSVGEQLQRSALA
jgi:hypothetical protein